jgi:hypothetical protein
MLMKARPAMAWGGTYLKITYVMLGVAILPAVIAVVRTFF